MIAPAQPQAKSQLIQSHNTTVLFSYCIFSYSAKFTGANYSKAKNFLAMGRHDSLPDTVSYAKVASVVKQN